MRLIGGCLAVVVVAVVVSSTHVCHANKRFSVTSAVPARSRDGSIAVGKKSLSRNFVTSTPAIGDGTASRSSEIFNLIKGIVGVGVLSLPAGIAAFGDAPSAVIPAVLLIAAIGAISGYNFSLIGRVCAYTGGTSYTDAWSKAIGEETSWIPAVSCTLKTFAAVLAYSMVLAETFQGILNTAGFKVTRTQTLITLTIVLLLPLCLLKDLSSLAPFSLLGIAGMIFTVFAMAVRYFGGGYASPSGKFLANVASDLQPAFGNKGASSVFSPNSFILICMLSTAYMAHFNAPKFYNELENNTIKRFNSVVTTSFGVSILIFAAATALGFATFGKGASGFVLSNYSTNDTLMGASRIAVAASLIFTYPLVFLGCRDGVLDVLKVSKADRTDATLNNLTVAILSLITGAALLVQDLSFVLSFGGATLGNALIYVYPALMFRAVVKKMGDNAPASLKKEVNFATFSAALGIVMGIVGASMAVKRQVAAH